MFRRVQARPRLLWNNRNGRSALFTVGGMSEHRRGGSVPGATLRDGSSHSENLDTTRIDGGFVGRFLTAGGRVLAAEQARSRSTTTIRSATIRERSRRGTWFGETSMTGTSGKNTWVGGAAGSAGHAAFNRSRTGSTTPTTPSGCSVRTISHSTSESSCPPAGGWTRTASSGRSRVRSCRRCCDSAAASRRESLAVAGMSLPRRSRTRQRRPGLRRLRRSEC